MFVKKKLNKKIIFSKSFPIRSSSDRDWDFSLPRTRMNPPSQAGVRGADGPSAGVKGGAAPFSLYDDVLRVVLRFLGLRTRAEVASVSKQWNRVTEIGIVEGLCEKRIRQWSDVVRLGRSTVARNHITKLVFNRLEWLSNHALADFLAPLPSFRRLTVVRFDFTESPPESLARILRRCSALRVIDSAPFRHTNTAFMRNLLLSRSPMPQLQEIGYIHLDLSLAVRIPKCAPNLTHLNISPFLFRPKGIAPSLRTMLPHLHHLKNIVITGSHDDIICANLFGNMNRDTLRRVLFIQCSIDASMVEWLMQAPQLAVLRFHQCKVPNFATFSHPMLARFEVTDRVRHYPAAWFPQRQHNPKL
jgi:hypothetical protein